MWPVDKEVLDFYRKNKFTLAGLILLGENELIAEQPIREAMDKIYDQVQKGREIKTIDLAWTVIEEARMIASEAYVSAEKITYRKSLFQRITLSIKNFLLMEIMFPWKK